MGEFPYNVLFLSASTATKIYGNFKVIWALCHYICIYVYMYNIESKLM